MTPVEVAILVSIIFLLTLVSLSHLNSVNPHGNGTPGGRDALRRETKSLARGRKTSEEVLKEALRVAREVGKGGRKKWS